MTDPRPFDEDRTVLAGEYALGLLDDAGRVEAERLLARDTAFAALVARWEAELGDWLADDGGTPAPPAMWQRISAATGRAPSVIAPSGGRVPVRRASPVWPITALAASLAAVVFGSLWWTAPRPGSEPGAVIIAPAALDGLSVAQIASADQPRLVAAVYERTTGRLLARLSPIETSGRVPELWLIGADGKPQSLGKGQAGSTISLTLPPEARGLFADGATIAISLERPSPGLGKAPAGPILGTAKITAL